jgi:FG-GAP-like repeat
VIASDFRFHRSSQMNNVLPILFFLVFLSASQVTAQVTVLLGVVPSVGTAGQSLEVVIKGLAIPEGVSSSQVNFGSDITVQNIQALPSQILNVNGENVEVDAIRAAIAISTSASGTHFIRIGPSVLSFPAVFSVIRPNEEPPPGAETNFGNTQYTTHSFNPEGIIAADFTRDGREDLAVGTDGDYYTLLFRTIPGGKLGSVRRLREPEFASALVTSNDFNNDRNLDLALGNRNASELVIRAGTGGLNFRNPVRVALPAPAWAVVSGDFNGDNQADLVAVTRDTNGIQLLLGNVNGTFQPAHSLAAGDTPKSAAVADLNNDGLDDLIVGNFVGTVSIYIGNRISGLNQQRLKRIPVSIENLVAADFSGDGNPDIATIGEDSIVILRGKGNGDFFAPKRIRIVDFLFDIAAGDFNGDSKIDLAFSNFAAGQLSVITNQGNLRFSPPFNLNTGNDPKRIVAADFNGDHKADLAVTNYLSHTISVYLNLTQHGL